MLRVVEDSMARVNRYVTVREIRGHDPDLKHAVCFTSGPVHSPYSARGPKRNLSYKRCTFCPRAEQGECTGHVLEPTARIRIGGAPMALLQLDTYLHAQ